MSRRISVSGHTGFVGTALTRALRSRGDSVQGVSRATGDDLSTPGWCPKSTRPSTIVHLAALSGVPDSWDAPASYYSMNITSTLCMLEWARREQVSLIYVSTYVYGQPRYLPVDEEHPVDPGNPYARSKRMAEELCEAYARDFGLSVTIVRPFNLYGPGQQDDSLVGSIVKQIVAGGDILVKDLRPRRDYLYIGDLVEALLLLTCSPPEGFQIFNLGSGTSMSVEEVIVQAQEVAGSSGSPRCSQQPRLNEISECYADSSRFRERYEWSPRVSFRDGLVKTIAFYRQQVA